MTKDLVEHALFEKADHHSVILVPVSPLHEWNDVLEKLGKGVEHVFLDTPTNVDRLLKRRFSISGVARKLLIVDGLTTWDDPKSKVSFLQELEGQAAKKKQCFVVPVGPDILDPDILPPLQIEKYGIYDLPASPADDAWQEMGAPFQPVVGVLETLHAETGGSKPLAREILERAGSPATWEKVTEALRALRGDETSLLGRLRVAIQDRPELVDSVYRLTSEEDLRGFDEFRLLAAGIVRRKGRELSYAGPILRRFVERYFSADTLAEMYRTRDKPQREQVYLERYLDSPFFAGQRRTSKAEIFNRLAELAFVNRDELGYYRYSERYLKNVGLAETCLYLESSFVGRATEIVKGKGYSEYRAALDRFIDGLSIITGQPNVLLYTRDPSNEKALTCHAWRPTGEQNKGPAIRLEEPRFPVTRLLSGETDEIDVLDVFQNEDLDRDFVHERNLRSLLAWPVLSDGRRYGVAVLENPHSEKHPLPGPVRSIARRFLTETQIAVERAALVASEVELLSRFHLLLEAARTDKPADLVNLAQRIIHTSIPEIRVSSVRLFEGRERRRMRVVSVYPPDDKELEQLREHFMVISPTESPLEPLELKKIQGPVYKPDLSTLPIDSPIRKLMEARDLRWVMLYDLGEGEKRLGRVTFYGREEWKPQPQELELLEGVIQQITLALKNLNESASNERRESLLTALYNGLATLAERRPEQDTLQDFLRQVLEACCEVFEADVAHCLRLQEEARSWAQFTEILNANNEESQHLDLLASAGELADSIPKQISYVQIGEGMSGYTVAKAMEDPDFALHISSDVTKANGAFKEYVPGIRSAIAIVLRRRTGRVLGVFTIESRKVDHFDDRAVDLARDVARELASAIEFVDLLDALSRQELVEELGLVSADLAHWLGNVLPLARNPTERALQAMQRSDPELLSIAENGLEEAVRLLNLALKMREELLQPYLRNQPREPVDMSEVIQSAIDTLPNQHNQSIEFESADDVPEISGLRNALERLAHALLRNAQDAVERAADPKIEISLRADKGKGMICLQMKDNGHGADPLEFREYMRPFKGTKPPTQGTGLGLWTTQRVVDAHEGRIRFITQPNQGMTIQLWLPIIRE